MDEELIFLAVAICAEVSAAAALKSSQGITRLWPSLLTVVGYGISFYFLALTLRVIPVGIADAMGPGAGIVLIWPGGVGHSWAAAGRAGDAGHGADRGRCSGDQRVLQSDPALGCNGRRG